MAIEARIDFLGEKGIHQGVPWNRLTLAVRDPNTGETHDYTDYTATLTIFPDPDAGESLHARPPILTVNSASGAIELGLFDGGEFGPFNVHTHLSQSLTSNLSPWGRGTYNLDILSPIGRPEIRLYGAIDLQEGRRHE